MKIRVSIILIASASLGTGIAYHLLRTPSPSQTPKTASVEPAPAVSPETVPGKSMREVLPEPASPPPPQSVRRVAIAPVKPATTPAKHPAEQTKAQHDAAGQWWGQQARRFNQLLEQLDREQDPARRRNLIQSLAAFVRVDTLGALDWAMGLQDPEEKRAALENINKYALSGIGARIGTDQTGFPKIMDTTVLSAVGATGMVEPGDYIVGMVDENGTTISFKDLRVQDIVAHLRGQPGSDLQLLMERTPADGQGDSYTFDVPVQRSLLVIQPPH